MSIAIAFAFVVACAFCAGGLYLLLRPGSRLSDTVTGALAVLVGAFGIMLTTAPAFAAEAAEAAGGGGHAVAIPPELVATMVDIVVTLLGIGGLWLVRQAAGWLHVDRESKLALRMEDGMAAALGWARERLLDEGRDLQAVDVRSDLVAAAAGYLLPKMPATLKALRIDEAGLRERLAGRLDLVAPRDGVLSVVGRVTR